MNNMNDELLTRERDLKERANAALTAQDWEEVHRYAVALAALYEQLEADAHIDIEARCRWSAMKEQWRDYAKRFAKFVPESTPEAVSSSPTTTPAQPVRPADPVRAARMLGLSSSAVATNGGDDRKKAKQARPSSNKEPGTKNQEPPSTEDDKKDSWLLKERPKISFTDIIGLDDLKQRVQRFVIKFKHPEEVAKWKGAKLGDRMILFGPPGTGKTMFAKAVAHDIDADFFLVKGSNVLDKWVGESQKNVARLFEAVRKSKRAVVFLDEIEGMLSKRGSSSTVRDSVVSEFLQEMEGLSSPNTSVLFIGATNLPSELDDAIVSRFGSMFYVPLPDKPARRGLLQRGFANFAYGCDPDVSLDVIADKLEGQSMRSVHRLIDELMDVGILNSAEGKPYRLSNKDVEEALKSLPPPMTERELVKYRRMRQSG
jgi:SpoVK/Ycf46/Vps4 family AAA+-type ATPase